MAGEARKTVTVVFTDVTGSTSLGEQLDPEALRGVMARYFETAQTVLEKHGGTVEKFIGDAVMAVFGIPTMHEDDALRAVRAAAELRDELDGLNEELERERGVRIALRTGVNTGEVVVGDASLQQFYATGDAVNVAARLEQAAGPGEILIGDSTRHLVRDAVELEPLEDLELKGKADRVPGWRLAAVHADAPAFARRLESPLVGREDDLQRLVDAYEKACEQRRPHLCTVLGTPGVGKSRLAAELAARVESEATVVAGRCLSYGEGITFWPLVEIVRELEQSISLPALLADRPLQQVKALTGAGEASGSTEEGFWAVRKLLEGVAGERPLVVVLDDVHWAEPTFLDLVDHVLEFAGAAPLLLVALARPEFIDERPLWASRQDDRSLVRLEPLSEAQAAKLIETLAGGAELPPEVRRRIGNAAEGNPLFLEQMLAMLSAKGHENGDVAVPPTIQALLAARIDGLGADERAVIEPAAVVGQEFWREALLDLCPPDLAVSPALQRLIRKELIGRTDSTFIERDAFRFRHILIRDAAYAGIAKGRRAELHERFADWLEGTMPEYEEIVGYHLGQAFNYRAELGPLGESDRELGRRAGQKLGSAGLRAWERGDTTAAAQLLERAARLFPSGDPARFELLTTLGSALESAGRIEEAEELLANVAHEAAEAGDRRGEMRLRIELALVHFGHAHPQRRGLDPLVAEAIQVFEELGDDVGLSATWELISYEAWGALRWQEMAEAMERAVAHARRAGDQARIATCLSWLTASYTWGPAPVAEAIARIKEIREESEPGSYGEVSALTFLGWLEAMRGDIDKGRAFYKEGIARMTDLGAMVRRGARAMVGGYLEFLAGDPAAAEAELREGFRVLDEMGEKALLSTVAFILADAVYLQGRFKEAEEFTHVSERAADPEDIASQIGWRAVRSKILARRGEFDEADRLSEEAVRLAEQTDALAGHADALVSRGEVLSLAGRTEEAKTALQEAIRLYEAKGVVPAVEQARARLSELSG